MTLASEQIYVTGVYTNILLRTASDLASAATQTAITASANQIVSGAASQAQVASAASQSVDALANLVPVVSLYQGLMHRAPDLSGLASWAALSRAGASQSTIAEGFTRSDEFTSIYGTAPTTTAFLTALYANALGRAPDAKGLSDWTAFLGGVASPSKAQMALVGWAFTQSAEGVATWTVNSENWLYAGLNGTYPTTVSPITSTMTSVGALLPSQTAALALETKYATNAYTHILFRTATDLASASTKSAISNSANQITTGFTTEALNTIAVAKGAEATSTITPIISLYEGLLHRAPDVAGLASWVSLFRSGASQSVIAGGFASSAEFSSIYGTAPTTAAFLTALYANVLGRTPDAKGLSDWTAFLGGVASPSQAQMAVVASGFTQSTEGLARWTTDAQNWLMAGVRGSYPVTIGTITYTLSNGGALTATEASVVKFHLTTINVSPGALLNYTLTGVTSAQVLGGLLSGTAPVAADGTADIAVTLSPTPGLGLSGSISMALIAPPGAGVGSTLTASVALIETPAGGGGGGGGLGGTTIAINGSSANSFPGSTSPTTIDLTASQAILQVDQTGTSSANSMLLNFNAANLTLGSLTVGNGATNSDPGVLSINNNMATGVSTLTSLVDNAAVKGLTTIRVDDATSGSTTVIGSISDTGLKTLDISATQGAVTIGGVSPLSQNGLVIKMGTGADIISILQTTPSQANADLVSNFNNAKDQLKLGSTKVLAGTDYQTTVTVTDGFDTSDLTVTAFLANLGVGKGTAGTAAFDDGVNTWIATVSATGLTNVVELLGITNLVSLTGGAGGAGGLNLSTVAATSTTITVVGATNNGTVNNDSFLGTFGDLGGNTFGVGNTIGGGAGADTLVISPTGPSPAAASTFVDGLWTNITGIENLDLSTGAGVLTVSAGAFFNTAFATGVNVTATTSGGANNLNFGTFTGPVSINAIALGGGAQTINTGSGVSSISAVAIGAGAQSVTGGAGATSVSVTAAAGAQMITGANLTSVSATNTGAGAQTITSTGSAAVLVTAVGFSGAQTFSTAGGADTLTVTTSGGTINSFSTGAGNDVITLKAALTASTSNTVTAGSGADVLTLGTHVGAVDKLIDALGDSGTFVRPASNSISTATFDIVIGLQVSDTLQTAGNTLAAIVTGGFNLATSITAAGTAEMIRGTYTASAKTFVGAAGGLDSLLVVDAGAGALEATVLVGITAFSSHSGTNLFTV